MPVLEHLQPSNVLRYFEELAAIPHGSGNTKAVSDYCVAFAKARGLQVWQDENENVVIVKEAAPGYEAAPTVILQGHLDMVCEKDADCDLDMAKEGLRLKTDGAWVWADGTTLGADDGIAVAMALAALDDAKLQHPRLEVLLTVGEEVGMTGAAALDASGLRGRLLLNVDSDVEGELTVSCAGGIRANCHVPVDREPVDGAACEITVQGLTGGHSGMEINKGRANANMLMGRVLHGLSRQLPARVASLHGGMADNAIATKAVCTVVVPEAEAAQVQALAAECQAVFRHEYQTADPGISVTVTVQPGKRVSALTPASTGRVVSALMLLPNGIQSMSMDIPGLVQTSLNLGILRLEEQEAVATFSVRSALASEKQLLCSRIECLAALLGGSVTYAGDYPAWEFKKDSRLRDLVADVYEQQNGKKAVVQAIHAGLECGIFMGKLPGLDCISFGPNLKDIHTPRERMEVASVQRTWALICEVLRRAKEL